MSFRSPVMVLVLRPYTSGPKSAFSGLLCPISISARAENGVFRPCYVDLARVSDWGGKAG